MGNIINENKGFEIINRDFIFDNTLSDRARFVYIYMSAKPENWDFYTSVICKELGYSESTLRKYMDELIKSGWVERLEQKKNDNGKFGASMYVIHRVPNFTVRQNFRDGKNDTHKDIYNKENIYINKENKDKKGNAKKMPDFVAQEFQEAFETWLEYKHQRRESYKSELSLKACYNKLVKLSGNNPQTAIAIIEQSMANNWAGLFALKQEYDGKYQANIREQERAERAKGVLTTIARLAKENDEYLEGVRESDVVPF